MTARRFNAPTDIDLLLIGNPVPSEVEALSRKLERELDLEVNPVTLSPEEWTAATSGFVRQIKKQPLVPLMALTSNQSMTEVTASR